VTEEHVGARRSVVVAPRTSRVEQVDVRPASTGEIVVQVLVNGLCASDLPSWLDGPANGTPLRLGHEPVGRVVEVGGGVDAIAIGDLVTGRLVESFAELITVRASDAVVVPPGLHHESAVGEPLGCVVEALRRACLDTGERVAVVGLGFMGLTLLQLLATSDIGQLVAVDTREDARRTAMVHGAMAAFSPAEVLDTAEMRDGFDVVFEVTGVQAGLDVATSLAAPHGTLDIVGYHQSHRTVDMQAWNWKGLEVVNGHVRDPRRLTDSIRRGLAVVASGRIDYRSLFTHRYALSEIDHAYTDLHRKPEGFIKAVIYCNPDSPTTGR
jgi:threonine dehydrogenase-like Zn-dependent dehydrogenase